MTSVIRPAFLAGSLLKLPHALVADDQATKKEFKARILGSSFFFCYTNTMLSVIKDFQLAQLTTFGIGGTARFYTSVTSEAELLAAITYATEQSVPYIILSGGSNMLIADAGYSGLIIHNKLHGIQIEDTVLTIASGEVLLNALMYASEHGLGGWEKLGGIPGTVGGAVRGNAGAFGTEIGDFIQSVTVYDTAEGTYKNFDHSSCAFAYRNSLFKQSNKYIIIRCTILLSSSNGDDSKSLIQETILERERRHLQNVACAGSYFMNPVAPQNVQDLFATEKSALAKEGRVPAGWLIEKVGLKGFAVGGAVASTMHPNYVMNTGTATAQDVRAVAQKIQNEVQEQFGITLAEEVTLVGF